MVRPTPPVLWLVFYVAVIFFLFCFVCVVGGFCLDFFFFLIFFPPEQDRGKVLDTTSNNWSCGLLGMTLFHLFPTFRMTNLSDDELSAGQTLTFLHALEDFFTPSLVLPV